MCKSQSEIVDISKHFSWERNGRYLSRMDKSLAVATNQTYDQDTLTTSQLSFPGTWVNWGVQIKREGEKN